MLSPGMVKTEFILKATNDAKVAQQVYSALPVMQPDDMASAILHIISSPPHVEVQYFVCSGKVQGYFAILVGYERMIHSHNSTITKKCL